LILSDARTRLITFGGSSVSVTYSGGIPAHIVDFLFRHVPDQDDIPPYVTYHLTHDDQVGQLILHQDDTLIYTHRK
jgi:hypothetical protein